MQLKMDQLYSQKACASTDPSLVKSVAEFLHYMGYYGEAINLYQRAMTLLEPLLTEDLRLKHTHLLLCISDTYSKQGKLVEAKSASLKMLYFLEQHGGTASYNYANAMCTHATVLDGLGEVEEAVKNLSYAIPILEYVKGLNHAAIIGPRRCLGSILAKCGKFNEALACLNIALRITRVNFGTQHPRAAEVYNAFGCVFRAQQKPKEAEARFRQAYLIYKDYYGEAHPLTLLYAQNLGTVLEKDEEAVQLYERMLEFATSVRGVDELPMIWQICTNLASVYSRMRNFEKQQYYFSKANGGRRSMFYFNLSLILLYSLLHQGRRNQPQNIKAERAYTAIRVPSTNRSRSVHMAHAISSYTMAVATYMQETKKGQPPKSHHTQLLALLAFRSLYLVLYFVFYEKHAVIYSFSIIFHAYTISTLTKIKKI